MHTSAYCTYINTTSHLYVYVYIHTYIHTYIHIYMYTWCIHYIYIQHNTAAAVVSSTSAAMRRSSANSAWAKALEHFERISTGMVSRGCDGIIMDIDGLSIYMVYDGNIYIHIYVYKYKHGDYHIVSLWTLYGIIIHTHIYILFHQSIWGYDGILWGWQWGHNGSINAGHDQISDGKLSDCAVEGVLS